MNKISKSLIIFCIASIGTIYSNEPTTSFHIPEKIEFADQTIDLTRYDLRERFDREQIIIAYQQSNSLLVLKRANRYFPVIEPILKENAIPDDFKYLAVIESSLDPRSQSPAQAVGLWQLMPKTAEQYGLEVSDEVDERYHIVKSTEAACKYFKSAYNKYKSWTDVAISYNAGMGRISTEQDKQKVNDALDLLLSSESSRYLFRILAMKQFLSHPEKFGYKVAHSDLYPDIKTRQVIVNDSVSDWADWASNYHITYAQLKDFNIWLRDRKLTNPKKKEYVIDVPDKKDLYFKESQVSNHIWNEN